MIKLPNFLCSRIQSNNCMNHLETYTRQSLYRFHQCNCT